MRLLYTAADGTLCLTGDLRKDIPEYAILSHRWCDEEVTFEDITNGLGEDKIGYKKLKFCAREAKRHRLKYFWVDTCCIKKSDIAELSRSITSMYSWYAKAKHCYVYLADVQDEIGSSVWFSRGWTLQELLAPRRVDFFNKNGEFLGTREELVHIIQEATGIAREALTGTPLSHFSVQERFAWAARRTTFEPEDLAYCLMGIFDVSMPPLYGESVEKAFDRLKERISRKFDVDLMKMSIPGEISTHEASVNSMQHDLVDYQSLSRALTLPYEPSATLPPVIGRLPRNRTMVASTMAEKVLLERVAATPFPQVQQNGHSDTVAIGATKYLRLHKDIMSLQEASDDPDLQHELDRYREAAAFGAAEGLRLKTRTQDIFASLVWRVDVQRSSHLFQRLVIGSLIIHRMCRGEKDMSHSSG